MENQEVYNINNGSETIITHKKGLDDIKPVRIEINGTIDAPYEFIVKRCTEDRSESKDIGYFLDSLAHVLINREEMKITLVINETDGYLKGTVTGKLEFHPDFKKWSINSGAEFDNKTLSEFIKMNRSCFVSKSDAMKLSAELSNLKVKVDKEVEKSNDNRGNVRQLLAQQVIEMNIPKVFQMNVPIFKGKPAVQFEVEIYVNPNSFMVSLVSPEVNDIISEVRDSIIDDQKDLIINENPGLVVIEQ